MQTVEQVHAEVLATLREEQERGLDKEVAHGKADDALCRMLAALGYRDVVEAWEKVEKYYA